MCTFVYSSISDPTRGLNDVSGLVQETDFSPHIANAIYKDKLAFGSEVCGMMLACAVLDPFSFVVVVALLYFFCKLAVFHY
jgi:hypothetical protein